MTHRYPRLGSVRSIARANRLCQHCQERATHRIDVQEDHMRGNDSVFLVCGRGLELATTGLWTNLYTAIANTKAWRNGASLSATSSE